MNEKIEKLLEQISKKLDILVRKESIPQISEMKNLSFLFDKVNANWTSFKPLRLNNTRLFGYYNQERPTSLVELQEGWIPLRVSDKGELLVKLG